MEKEKDFSNNMALTQNSKILASDVSGAIKSITRSGTTFTYTTLGGSTGTFTQQDNNTTYSAGTGISISSNKITNTGVTSVNGQTGAVTVSTGTATIIPKCGAFYGRYQSSGNGGVTGWGSGTFSSWQDANNNTRTSWTAPAGGTWGGFQCRHKRELPVTIIPSRPLLEELHIRLLAIRFSSALPRNIH